MGGGAWNNRVKPRELIHKTNCTSAYNTVFPPSYRGCWPSTRMRYIHAQPKGPQVEVLFSLCFMCET